MLKVCESQGCKGLIKQLKLFIPVALETSQIQKGNWFLSSRHIPSLLLFPHFSCSLTSFPSLLFPQFSFSFSFFVCLHFLSCTFISPSPSFLLLYSLASHTFSITMSFLPRSITRPSFRTHQNYSGDQQSYLLYSTFSLCPTLLLSHDSTYALYVSRKTYDAQTRLPSNLALWCSLLPKHSSSLFNLY